MKPIRLLDDSLQVEIHYACEDADLEDNICIKIIESCVEEEKILRHDETHLYMTSDQAKELAEALLKAVGESQK